MSFEKATMFAWLLVKGADTNVQDTNGNTALHNALNNGSLHFVDELLKHGANCLIVIIFSHEPLYYAVRDGGDGGDEEKIESLLMKAR